LPSFLLLRLVEQRRRLLVCFLKRRIVAIERWVWKSEQEDFEGQVCSWIWDDLDDERREKTISIFFFSPPLRFFFLIFFRIFFAFPVFYVTIMDREVEMASKLRLKKKTIFFWFNPEQFVKSNKVFA